MYKKCLLFSYSCSNFKQYIIYCDEWNSNEKKSIDIENGDASIMYWRILIIPCMHGRLHFALEFLSNDLDWINVWEGKADEGDSSRGNTMQRQPKRKKEEREKIQCETASFSTANYRRRVITSILFRWSQFREQFYRIFSFFSLFSCYFTGTDSK